MLILKTKDFASSWKEMAYFENKFYLKLFMPFFGVVSKNVLQNTRGWNWKMLHSTEMPKGIIINVTFMGVASCYYTGVNDNN